MWLIGILAGEKKENGVQSIFKDIMNLKFSKLVKDMKSHIQESQGIPNRIINKKTS